MTTRTLYDDLAESVFYEIEDDDGWVHARQRGQDVLSMLSPTVARQIAAELILAADRAQRHVRWTVTDEGREILDLMARSVEDAAKDLVLSEHPEDDVDDIVVKLKHIAEVMRGKR